MGSNNHYGEQIMSEFLNMGGYAVYVWSSFAVFFIAMFIDFFGLKSKEKSVKRQIKSQLKRKNNF